MIDAFYFLNENYLPLVITIVFLLWLLFIWKEWSAQLNSKFFLNISIALVGLISLAMIALKPTILSENEPTIGVLLTKDYQNNRLDSLKKIHKNIKIISYEDNKPMATILDSVSSLFIIGNGIKSYDFWQLKNRNSQYLDTPVSRGIIKLKYDNKLFVGDQLIVKGQYQKPTKGHYLLVSDASGKTIDSVVLNNSPVLKFKFSTNTKVEGKFVYSIIEKDNLGNRISKQPLPVQILAKKKLRLLMVNSFPTFESKYLKNFLADDGHELIVRNKLTRGRFKYEYFNTPKTPIQSFSSEQLKTFDIILIDANSYKNLPNNAGNTLKNVIQKNGLGVFILPDDNFFNAQIKWSNFEFLNQNKTTIKFNKWPKVSWNAYPFVFKNNSRLEKVPQGNEQIVTAYQRNGKGRIGTTVINNSYQVLLKGNKRAYQGFWSQILSVLSKRHISDFKWNTNTLFAKLHEPFSFRVSSSLKKPVITSKRGVIPLIQNANISEVWNGKTYPTSLGWNKLQIKNDTLNTFNFYAIDSTKWQSLTAFNTVLENKRRFNSKVNVKRSKQVYRLVNSYWFFLVFILCFAYLWLIPKLKTN